MEKTALYVAAAGVCFVFACCSGGVGMLGMMAEHPDKSGHIVAAEGAEVRFLIAGVVSFGLMGAGAFCIAQAIRSRSTK